MWTSVSPCRLDYAKQKMGELNTTYTLFHAVQKEELAIVVGQCRLTL